MKWIKRDSVEFLRRQNPQPSGIAGGHTYRLPHSASADLCRQGQTYPRHAIGLSLY